MIASDLLNLPTVLGMGCGFLLGSFPTGYLMGKTIKGIDIRQHGSGNPGATNVFRVVGKTAGAATLLIDALKGYLPVHAALRMEPQNILFASWIGLAAIAGHNWSVFLAFKGGKGVATSAGVFLALAPLPTAIAAVFFLAGFFASGHASMGSMVAALALSVSTWFLSSSRFLAALAAFCAILVIFLHRKYISRLVRRQEPKFSIGDKDGP
jgi:glycerol-3-phosphate acyltransferase PlsY